MKILFYRFVLFYLRVLARIALRWHKPQIIGITGSAGKSSCRNAIWAVLKEGFPGQVKMIEKGNSETGIPLGILGVTIKDYTTLGWARSLLKALLGLGYLKGTKYLIVEMGIDEPFWPKNMEYLLKIVKPHIAVFLNVHPVHTEQFSKVAKGREGVLRAIAREKGKIITKSGCKIGIYNRDNKYVREVIEGATTTCELYSFGRGKENFVILQDWEVLEEGTRFSFKINREKVEIFLKGYILPQAYLETLAPSVAIGKLLGLPLGVIQKGLQENFYLPPSRASLFVGIKDTLILDSSYNASLNPTLEMLNLAHLLAQKQERPLIFCFGDMRELGPLAQEEHLRVAKEAKEKVDELYLVGQITKEVVLPYLQDSPGKIERIKWFPSSKLLGEFLKEKVTPRALLLFKGSQNTIFLEEAIKPLLLNPEDSQKLCRQSKFWLRKKEKLWQNLKTENIEHAGSYPTPY